MTTCKLTKPPLQHHIQHHTSPKAFLVNLTHPLLHTSRSVAAIMATLQSTRYNTAMSFINTFNSLSAPTFLSLLSPTCTHIFALSPSTASHTNQQFAAHMSSLSQILKHFPVYPKEVIENEGQNQVFPFHPYPIFSLLELWRSREDDEYVECWCE